EREAREPEPVARPDAQLRIANLQRQPQNAERILPPAVVAQRLVGLDGLLERSMLVLEIEPTALAFAHVRSLRVAVELGARSVHLADGDERVDDLERVVI